MNNLTPETLAELRRLLDEAPPLPYRDSPATHGDPSNGPTYVALEAQREGRWEEVATGNYERWCGMGIALAAAAVNALPAMLDAAAERDDLAAALRYREEQVTRRGAERDALAPITPVLDADGQPVVRTVGDLTARHIGKRVRVDGFEGELVALVALFDGIVTVEVLTVDDFSAPRRCTLDTPCEVLP